MRPKYVVNFLRNASGIGLGVALNELSHVGVKAGAGGILLHRAAEAWAKMGHAQEKSATFFAGRFGQSDSL